jgi:aryl-alcohol dehydrogenase-like predicted oxidoreductase
MEYRYFPNTDLKTSIIGFGTYELNKEYGPIDDDEVTDAIRRALDLGVTCIDTAPVYGFGHAEDVVGKALGDRRKDVILVTKCGIRGGERNKRIFNGRRESILEEIDQSLKLLRTDYVDLYLIHYSPARTGTPMEETLNTLHEIRASGRARYVGVSNYVLDEMKEAVNFGPIATSQMVYNLFDHRNEPNIAFCREHGIGVMTHGSLSYGLLAGEFHKDYVFDPADWRRRGNLRGLPLLEGENLIKNLEVVERLKEVAHSIGKTLPQMALNWVSHQPGVTVSLTGCRNCSQIEENVGGAGWRLSEEDKKRAEAVMLDAAGNTGYPVG